MSEPIRRARVGGRAQYLLMLPILLSLGACLDHSITPYERNYGTLLVTATNEQGAPVPGVVLDLHDWARRMALGQTGASGTYLFKYLPAEQYLIAFTPPADYVAGPNQQNPVGGIMIEKGEVSEWSITLARTPGSDRSPSPDSLSGGN